MTGDHIGGQLADETTVVTESAKEPFLVVDNLTVRFPTHDGFVQAVTGLSYTVESRRDLGHRR